MMKVKQQISDLLASRQITRFGFAPLTRPLTMDFYLNWIEKNQHGDMEYLKNHAAKKAEPQIFFPKARTAIVIAFQYFPTPEPTRTTKLAGARTAIYSRGKDYHHWIGQKLSDICVELKARFPAEEFAGFVDSGPVLERDLARRAGLGWFGKNTCLIHPKHGSFFFLSEIYTSLDIELEDKLQPDHCGTCTRCIDICPTGALSPRNLDARKCISYLTIESKAVAPIELRKQIGDWLYGCDLCQSICPWNVKFYKNELKIENQEAKREDVVKDLHFILSSSNKTLGKAFRDSSLSRASGNKLKRNAMIVAANKKLIELKDLIASYRSHEYFKDLCEWTLAELGV